jgi:hypothetical protein
MENEDGAPGSHLGQPEGMSVIYGAPSKHIKYAGKHTDGENNRMFVECPSVTCHQ